MVEIGLKRPEAYSHNRTSVGNIPMNAHNG